SDCCDEPRPWRTCSRRTRRRRRARRSSAAREPASRGGAGSRNLRANLKAALVTGAAGGIGAAIVGRLEADGWSVHGVDIADGDLATREGNRNVVDGALERFGWLDAVIANAGLQHVAPVAEFPEERWDTLLAVLLRSPFLLARYG